MANTNELGSLMKNITNIKTRMDAMQRELSDLTQRVNELSSTSARNPTSPIPPSSQQPTTAGLPPLPSIPTPEVPGPPTNRTAPLALQQASIPTREPNEPQASNRQAHQVYLRGPWYLNSYNHNDGIETIHLSNQNSSTQLGLPLTTSGGNSLLRNPSTGNGPNGSRNDEGARGDHPSHRRSIVGQHEDGHSDFRTSGLGFGGIAPPMAPGDQGQDRADRPPAIDRASLPQRIEAGVMDDKSGNEEETTESTAAEREGFQGLHRDNTRSEPPRSQTGPRRGKTKTPEKDVAHFEQSPPARSPERHSTKQGDPETNRFWTMEEIVGPAKDTWNEQALRDVEEAQANAPPSSHRRSSRLAQRYHPQETATAAHDTSNSKAPPPSKRKRVNTHDGEDLEVDDEISTRRPKHRKRTHRPAHNDAENFETPGQDLSGRSGSNMRSKRSARMYPAGEGKRRRGGSTAGWRLESVDEEDGDDVAGDDDNDADVGKDDTEGSTNDITKHLDSGNNDGASRKEQPPPTTPSPDDQERVNPPRTAITPPSRTRSDSPDARDPNMTLPMARNILLDASEEEMEKLAEIGVIGAIEAAQIVLATRSSLANYPPGQMQDNSSPDQRTSREELNSTNVTDHQARTVLANMTDGGRLGFYNDHPGDRVTAVSTYLQQLGLTFDEWQEHQEIHRHIEADNGSVQSSDQRDQDGSGGAMKPKRKKKGPTDRYERGEK